MLSLGNRAVMLILSKKGKKARMLIGFHGPPTEGVTDPARHISLVTADPPVFLRSSGPNTEDSP